MNTAVLIPAYEPDNKLVELVKSLTSFEIPLILVVNDGSSPECMEIFEQLDKFENCKVVHHLSNFGKGRAIKTGMKEILDFDSNIVGCITVDADGQHLTHDIINIINHFENQPDTLFLGSRNFKNDHVPLRSKIGNIVTRAIYRNLTGLNLIDTQTGLRAIPNYAMIEFDSVEGERYDFEMSMLMDAKKLSIPIVEIEIDTVYLSDNNSHFRTFVDGYKVYKQLLSFGFASMICAAIDVGMFTLVFYLMTKYNISSELLVATAIARITSSAVNFSLNKSLVFGVEGSNIKHLSKYYTLCVCQLISSWLLLKGIHAIGFGNIVFQKILVDIFLFFISYRIQHKFIFKK